MVRNDVGSAAAMEGGGDDGDGTGGIIDNVE
jgi:hypothetical protein